MHQAGAAMWSSESIEKSAAPRTFAPALTYENVLDRHPTIPAFLQSWRAKGEPKGRVLLVHGASAGSRTFMIPNGGLVRYLQDSGYDVWTLDWRGSNLVNEAVAGDPGYKQTDKFSELAWQFDLDKAVKDLEWALAEIAKQTEKLKAFPLGIVAHCIGGGLVAQAIAERRVGAGSAPLVGPIVLSTLALFYRVGLDGWFKGNDYVLEELSNVEGFANKCHPTISPWAADPKSHRAWPPALQQLYDVWRQSTLPHPCKNEFCHRASFMFGMPYRPNDIKPLHDAREPAGLWQQFGDMPLKLYMHCVQNLRRGFAAPFDGSTVPLARQMTEATATATTEESNSQDSKEPPYLISAPFVGDGTHEPPRRITLITGEENQVWHRDSVDRMHEWLVNKCRAAALKRRGSRHGRDPAEFFTKHVLAGYGHQDLYWSSRAKEDVYPLIERALSGR